jgi:GAF domain/ANTAR domain
MWLPPLRAADGVCGAARWAGDRTVGLVRAGIDLGWRRFAYLYGTEWLLVIRRWLVLLDGWPAEMSDRGRPGSSLLARICAACVRSVPVTGAAVWLMTDAGHRAMVHASDVVVARLGDAQFDLGEGPSIHAFRQRHPVLVSDVGEPGAALAAGARALFAFPLQLGAAELGVLLLYCDRAAELDAAQYARVLRLADAAFFALLDLLSGSATTSADGDMNGHRTGADVAFRRAEVYQAAGMVMAHLGVSIEDATVRLHAYAYANDRPVAEVARDIIARVLRLDDDNDDEQSGMEERP